jgi:transcription elongation factor GreA
MITRAEIINGSGKVDLVRVGSKVKVKSDGVETEYEIVGVAEADPVAGKISNESPLGRSFLGRRIGDKIQIQIPKGMVTYTILEIR